MESTNKRIKLVDLSADDQLPPKRKFLGWARRALKKSRPPKDTLPCMHSHNYTVYRGLYPSCALLSLVR